MDTPRFNTDLSLRMVNVLRLLHLGGSKHKFSPQIIYSVLMNDPRRLTSPKFPAWFKQYEPDPFLPTVWEDWTDAEKRALIRRVFSEIDLSVMVAMFCIPEQVVVEITDVVNGRSKREETPSYKELLAEIQEEDGLDKGLRDFSADRLAEYAKRVDITNPVNRLTVRNMISLEIQILKLEKEILRTDVTTELYRSLQQVLTSLQQSFSRCAEDLAQLERQSGRKPDETFDMVLKKIQTVRNDWRDISQFQKMEEARLIDIMVQVHKVDLNDLITPPAQNKRTKQRKKSFLNAIPSTEENTEGDDFVLVTDK